jgi:hypothetical protein
MSLAFNQPCYNETKERIRFWVEQFGEALDLPEFWRDIENLF